MVDPYCFVRLTRGSDPLTCSHDTGRVPFNTSHISMALISRTIQGQTQWSPQFRTCGVSQTAEYKWSIMINFVEDFVLLGIMILGVLHKRNATHLWNMLYLQGLFWILTATLTELPSMVCCLVVAKTACALIPLIQALSFRNINGTYDIE